MEETEETCLAMETFCRSPPDKRAPVTPRANNKITAKNTWSVILGSILTPQLPSTVQYSAVQSLCHSFYLQCIRTSLPHGCGQPLAQLGHGGA